MTAVLVLAGVSVLLSALTLLIVSTVSERITVLQAMLQRAASRNTKRR